MTQFAHSNPPRQAAPFYISDVYLDIEVLADHFEAIKEMFLLEDEPTEEADTDDAADDLPF